MADLPVSRLDAEAWVADAGAGITLDSLSALCLSYASFQRSQISCSASLGGAAVARECEAFAGAAASVALAAGARHRQIKIVSQGIRFMMRMLM